MKSQVTLSSMLRSEKTVVFSIAMIVFTAFSYLRGGPFEDSLTPYFKYLALAFSEGQTYLLNSPLVPIDLILYNNKYFLYWPPMPAVVHFILNSLLPFTLTDVFTNIIFAALNGVLVMHLLTLFSRHVLNLQRNLITLLTVFFLFGTSHFPLSPYGTVWAVSQVYGITFVLLGYICALQWTNNKAPILCAFFFGCAFLCRLTLVVNIIWPCWYIIHNSKTVSDKFQKILIVASVFCLFVAIYGYYNWIRFGSPLEIGYRFHLVSSFFTNDFHKYGAFSTHYIGQNLYYHFIHYPFPYTDETFMGGSFFLLSPLYFYLFRLIYRNNKPFTYDIRILSLSCFISYIPLALIMGTGMVQFGSRYLLDFAVPILAMLAFALYDIKNLRIAWVLVIVSIIHFSIGTVIKSH